MSLGRDRCKINKCCFGRVQGHDKNAKDHKVGHDALQRTDPLPKSGATSFLIRNTLSLHFMTKLPFADSYNISAGGIHAPHMITDSVVPVVVVDLVQVYNRARILV